MNTKISDEVLMKRLAVIISDFPRYTLKELAEAAGISKASLYRICGTRDHLTELLTREAQTCIESVIRTARTKYTDYGMGIECLIQEHLKNKEFLLYAQMAEICLKDHNQEKYLTAMDGFFLEGKRQGFFKVELDQAALTELFIAIFAGIIDGERRGRLAPAMSYQIFRDVFLNGTVQNGGNG